MSTAPDKRADCGHQFEDEPKCAPAFRNTYECPCGNTWEDEWSCGCDDDCSECGRTIEASTSTEVAPCACDYLGES